MFIFIIADQIFFSDLSHLVLDEADTLFDESFEERSLEILGKLKVLSLISIKLQYTEIMNFND